MNCYSPVLPKIVSGHSDMRRTTVKPPLMDLLELLTFPYKHIWSDCTELEVTGHKPMFVLCLAMFSWFLSFFFFCMTLHGWTLDNKFLRDGASCHLPRAKSWFLDMELLCCEVKSWTRLESVTVHVDRWFLNSLLQWWDQWVGKGSQKCQGCDWVAVCP